MKSIKVIFLFILVLSYFNTFAQNEQELFIEQLDKKEGYDICATGNCNPGDIVITIKSLIPDLLFDSNIFDFKDIRYDNTSNEYVFCHPNEHFILTIGAKGYTYKNIIIDGESNKYAFKVESKLARGTIFFRTIPNNAWVDFGLQGISPQLTGLPIEMTSGEYPVKIYKDGYRSIDTVIVIPSDGSSKSMDLIMEQNFSRILLDISTADGSQFQAYPIIEMDTNRIYMVDFFNQYNIKSFDDMGNLEYFKIYKGGYIPVHDKAYNIRITSPGYKTYTTTLQAIKGTTVPLKVQLEPIAGYLTIRDGKNATGAKVILNNEEIGQVPIYRLKTRMGNHVLKFEKEGFATPDEHYNLIITEDIEEVMSVTMTRFKNYYISSEPSGAEIYLNGQRKGFTPENIIIKEGENELVISKTGFLDKKYKFIIDHNSQIRNETINVVLETTHPIKIMSEERGAKIVIKREGQVVSSDARTPADLLLPYGDYEIELYQARHKCYSGSFVHDGSTDKFVFPAYSRGTVTTLVVNYYFGKTQGDVITKEGTIPRYKLIGNVHLGRFNVFPGFSTSVFRTTVFGIDEKYRNTLVATDNPLKNKDEANYNNILFSGSCLFLNGEFRVGGYFLKRIGTCGVISYAWSPPLKDILSLSHINGHDLFFGLEVTSRISYFNVNFKLGLQKYWGKYNYLVNKKASNILLEDGSRIDDKFFSEDFKVSAFVFTIGFTLGQTVSRGNNMLKVF